MGKRFASIGVLVAAVLAGPLPGRAAAGDIYTYAGTSLNDGIPARIARLEQPARLLLDANGIVFADSWLSTVVRIDQAGIIHTLAGTGTSGFSGDGGPATASMLNEPSGVAEDGAGNIYVADAGNSRVRKIDAASGTITTIAGSVPGFAGDGGPASQALFYSPTDVAFDAAGNLFVSDIGSNRVRRIDAATGIITTIAGGGFSDGTSGLATDAYLVPYGLTVDALGNLYITKAYVSGAIYKVDPQGNISRPVLATGPFDVFVDAAGNLYYTEEFASDVRKLAPGGSPVVVAGTGSKGNSGDGGPATAAMLVGPSGIAVDRDGTMTIADASGRRIRRVDGASGNISTIAGPWGDGTTSGRAFLYHPGGIAVGPSGNLAIADEFHQAVRSMSPSGPLSTAWGDGFPLNANGDQFLTAFLAGPVDVAYDDAGNLYLADHKMIGRLSPSGHIDRFAGFGTPQEFFYPNAVAVDRQGSTLYWTEVGLDGVTVDSLTLGQTFTYGGGFCDTSQGNYSGDGGPAVLAGMCEPEGIAVDRAGNLYIADTDNFRIRKVDALTGIITTIAGNGRRFASPDGDGGPATQATLGFVNDVAVDPAGNVYITDTNRVRRIDTSGIITTVAGTGDTGPAQSGVPALGATFGGLLHVATDSLGNLFISDAWNDRIRGIQDAARAPAVLASAATVDFGDQYATATSAPRDVKIGNSGIGVLDIDGISSSGDAASFPITFDGCTEDAVAPGGACRLSIAFSPPAIGSYSATYTLATNAGQVVLTLSGNGIYWVVAAPSSLSFGSQIVGTKSAPQTVTVTNHGSPTESVGALKVSGRGNSDFLISSDGCSKATLGPGASCSASIVFSPRTSGARSETLSIPVGDHTLTVALGGTGILSI